MPSEASACDIEEAPIGFGVLNDRFGLSINGKNQWFSRFFPMLKKFRRIAAKCGHGLNVFLDIEHDGLGCRDSTCKGVEEGGQLRREP